MTEIGVSPGSLAAAPAWAEMASPTLRVREFDSGLPTTTAIPLLMSIRISLRWRVDAAPGRVTVDAWPPRSTLGSS